MREYVGMAYDVLFDGYRAISRDEFDAMSVAARAHIEPILEPVDWSQIDTTHHTPEEMERLSREWAAEFNSAVYKAKMDAAVERLLRPMPYFP